MKIKSILAGLCFLLAGTFANAQGLEGIVVEKYYVSNAADGSSANADLSGAGYTTGTLPVGSVTWRIYADLAPGWGVQSVYGIPSHPLVLSTSTNFFNHPNGNTTGGNFTSNGTAILGSGTTLLDSYLACGAVAPGRFGVLKSEDVTGATPAAGGPNYIAAASTVLANNAPGVGSLTSVDGIYNVSGTPALLALTLLGDAAAAPVNIFTDGSVVGNSFSSTNVSWGVLGEQVGAFPAGTNRVLIGQFTSDGVFTYQLNIQIRNNTTFAVENYVPSNATGSEILLPALAGTVNQPNALPSVSITAPTTGSSFLVGDAVAIAATAADTDGSVAQVEFFVDGVSVGVDNSAPYTANYIAVVGTHIITARATDNLGGQTTSAGVTITVGSVIAPTVSITAPTAGSTFVLGDAVNITANAADADGSVTQVEFFLNGVSLGVDNTAPYAFSWVANATGSQSLTAVATDNVNATGISAPVSINVFDSASAYAVISSSNQCDINTFCLPINALAPVNDVIGYDIVLNYDKTIVQPNGIITVANDLVDPNYTSTAYSVDTAAGQMLISIFFNGTAPLTTEFNGSGELVCVGFSKLAAFGAADTAQFSIPSLQESYINGVQPKVVSPGEYSTYQDSIFTSTLRFWLNNLPIRYDASSPSTYLITNIYGSNNTTCDTVSLAQGAAVQPDLNGDFSYNYNNGSHINFQHDIAATTSVQPVINGFDAFLTRRVLINDVTFQPSIYQILAMDVNLDGVISAGDLSQINQRTVLILPEYRQAWNYTAAGVNTNNRLPSRDWTFVDGDRLNTDPSYLISSTYPANDGIGYSKSNLPVVPFCLEVPTFLQGSCRVIGGETYTGILLGDVNGNYATVANNGSFRMDGGDKVVVDLAAAKVSGNYVDVPVTFTASEKINALDLAVNMNNSNLKYHSVSSANGSVEVLANVADDNMLRITSNSLNTLENGTTVITVRFVANAEVSVNDVKVEEAYLNGEKVGSSVTGSSSADMITVYPNPTTGILNVVSVEDATVQILDMEGRVVMAQANVNALQKYEMNISHLADGVYMVKSFNDSFTSMKKIVVKK